jgi:hypothetical protein
MWELVGALSLVREIQPKTRDYNYHIAVGGGVVNNGSSEKDLDLYFLPLDNGSREDHNGLIAFLSQRFGRPRPIGDDEAYANQHTAYRSKIKFMVGGRRIDAFVM